MLSLRLAALTQRGYEFEKPKQAILGRPFAGDDEHCRIRTDAS